MIKKSIFLLTTLILFSMLSCSNDDDSTTDDSNDYTGSYTLTSITSNTPLDPDVTGVFDETEILDNLGCTSLMILNEDKSFSWDYVVIDQIINNIMGETSYMEMECIPFTGSNGTYELVNGSALSFMFETSLSDINGALNDEVVTIVINADLAVDNGGTVGASNVALTLTYEK